MSALLNSLWFSLLLYGIGQLTQETKEIAGAAAILLFLSSLIADMAFRALLKASAWIRNKTIGKPDQIKIPALRNIERMLDESGDIYERRFLVKYLKDQSCLAWKAEEVDQIVCLIRKAEKRIKEDSNGPTN